MTTNHKPATPLPWRDEEGDAGGRHITADAKGDDAIACTYDESDFAAAAQDAAYIAHAANAYPKLVEALHDVLRQVKAYEGQHDRLRDLLRELGEDA